MSLDHLDIEALKICVELYLKASQERRNRLDQLYSKRAYTEQSILKSELKLGEISDGQHQQLLDELDDRMAKHDDGADKWQQLIQYFEELLKRLAEMQEGMGGVGHAA